MNNHRRKLTRQYVTTLQKYLTDGSEAVLEEAYELGRMAIAKDVGILDMARIHEEALENLFQPVLALEGHDLVLKSTETFLLQALSPFEATHRGFRETNLKLQELIDILEERNQELAGINQELKTEISERNRTEKALRQSEEHLRAMFNEARRMQESLRNLSNQILYAQEEERKRISRELHDEVGQALTAVNMNLESLKKNGAAKSLLTIRKLADTQSLLQATMETVHRFARELRPAMLDELGLLPALRSYLKAFANRTGLRVNFRGNPIAEKLGADQKTVVFRAAQESLTNVAKHAHASRVEVSICKLKNGICMEVADNGRSFKQDLLNSAKSKTRLGLLGMQERVRLVSGKFTVKPQPGKGTTIQVVVPFVSAGAAILPKRVRNNDANKKKFPDLSDVRVVGKL